MADRQEPRPATVSFLSEARKALGEYAKLRRELALVQTDERIAFFIHRILWIAISAITATIALGAAWYWVTWDLRDQGWKPWPLAMLSIGFFGLPAAACALLSTRATQPKPSASKLRRGRPQASPETVTETLPSRKL